MAHCLLTSIVVVQYFVPIVRITVGRLRLHSRYQITKSSNRCFGCAMRATQDFAPLPHSSLTASKASTHMGTAFGALNSHCVPRQFCSGPSDSCSQEALRLASFTITETIPPWYTGIQTVLFHYLLQYVPCTIQHQKTIQENAHSQTVLGLPSAINSWVLEAPPFRSHVVHTGHGLDLARLISHFNLPPKAVHDHA